MCSSKRSRDKQEYFKKCTGVRPTPKQNYQVPGVQPAIKNNNIRVVTKISIEQRVINTPPLAY